mgnify:FL=1
MILGVIFIAAKSNAQSAQSPDEATKVQTTQTAQNTSGNFVDKNGDGVCDNHQNHGKQATCAKFVDGNGDGVCDNGKGEGKCGHATSCGKGMQKANCEGMQKSNCEGMSKAGCSSKEKGHQHGHKECKQTTSSKPWKK